jgi:hypothetical protein
MRFFGILLTSLAIILFMLACNEPGPVDQPSSEVMTSIWDEANGTFHIFREDQLVAVYQRDTESGVRSISNAITELYAVERPWQNLLADVSPLVPPQILVEVDDAYISDGCTNNPGDSACDYFAHHNPEVEILQASGTKVKFRVRATASQHYDQATPINYFSEMTMTMPFHPTHTVIKYEVETILDQSVNVRHALRPLPFYELVRNLYDNVSYLNADCQNVSTVPIPTGEEEYMTFIQQSPVCNDRPWAAIIHNDNGNLGMILQSHDWSSGAPELVSYTETANHPLKPNLYYQSTDHSRVYSSGNWKGSIIFLAYTNAPDYISVRDFRDNFVE